MLSGNATSGSANSDRLTFSYVAIARVGIGMLRFERARCAVAQVLEGIDRRIRRSQTRMTVLPPWWQASWLRSKLREGRTAELDVLRRMCAIQACDVEKMSLAVTPGLEMPSSR